MLQKVWRNLRRKNKIFAMVLAFGIFGMILSGCASGAGKSAVVDDGKGSGVPLNYVQLGNEQEAFDGKESAAVTDVVATEIPEMQKDAGETEENQGLVGAEENCEDTEPADGDSDLADVEQTELEESGNILSKETESQKDSGASSDVSETMGEGQELSEESQERVERGQQGKGQEEGETEDTGQAWKSAYLEVIYHLWDYLVPRYESLTYEDSRKKFDDPMNIYIFYLGLHDFDGDGTLELITGDGRGLAVFTYKDDHVEKIADLCPPDRTAIWGTNGVYFKDNSIGIASSGSGGTEWVDFGYLEGEYMLGHCNEINPCEPITINGREATKEEVEKIYTMDFDKIEEEERRERFRLTNENGTWILKATWWSDEECVLDIDFDFDSVIW